MNPGDTVAIYIRLSDEDRDLDGSGKSESESVSNQRDMLMEFIGRTPWLAKARVEEFCDDGWSGKNFERPAVKKLLKQARDGKIQCIVVKDLSRFGRDYLEVGNYLSRIFPILGIRFVSINDQFDSAREMETDGLETAVKTLIYDLYSRDLSTKIRSARRTRAEKGYYISAHPPFGYIKDPADRHRLLVDDEAARIVRYIFSLTASGRSPGETAKLLNEGGIPTRMGYKRAHGYSLDWQSVREENFWTGTAVRVIVQDERYTGKAVYGRRAPVSIGDRVHSTKVERTGWIVVNGAHPAIISTDIFLAANEKIRARGPGGQRKNRQFFIRKLFCGVCGHALRRTPAAEPYYFCVTNRFTRGFPCTGQRFSETALRELAGITLRLQAECSFSLESVFSEIRRGGKGAAEAPLQTRKNIDLELGRIARAKRQLYEGFVSGGCSRERYLEEKEALSSRQKILEARQGHQKAADAFRANDAWEEEGWFARELIDRMIRRIEVWPDARIEITWNYREPAFFSPEETGGDVHATGSHTG